MKVWQPLLICGQDVSLWTSASIMGSKVQATQAGALASKQLADSDLSTAMIKERAAQPTQADGHHQLNS